MDQSFVKKEYKQPLVSQDQEQNCDEDCQAMCNLFNQGDCSHCGFVITRNRTRLRIRKECNRRENKTKRATKIVKQCVTCSISTETAHIAAASDVLTQMKGKLLKV